MDKNTSDAHQDKTFKYMHYAYALLTACISVYVLIENADKWQIIAALMTLFSMIITIRHRMHFVNPFWGMILPYLELMIVLPLSYFTKSAVSLWLILIINLDVIIDYENRYSLSFTVISYSVYMIVYLMKLQPPTFFDGVLVFVIGMVQYSIIMSVGFMAQKFYIQNIKYRQLVANQKVQMLELEQMAVINERNRMAGEIHDTVGHQLTTALVQLEATSAILGQDEEQVRRRLGIVKDQVRMGLNELRASISELKDERFDDYTEILNTFAKRVHDTTGIRVYPSFQCADEIPMKSRKVLYYMSMEAMTNAIKHGHCRTIWWRVSCDDQFIIVSIENDGIKPDRVTPGFGLCRMNEQIENLGGELRHYHGEHGFAVEAAIKIR